MEIGISEFWASCPAHFVRVLCIQGPTASGKTTLASRVESVFRKARTTFFTLHMDDYYKSLPEAVDEGSYDFDNPGALDWDKIFEVVDGIHDGDENLKIFERSFAAKSSSGPICIENPKPKFLIVEGVFSFFVFSERFFDLSRCDPWRRSDEDEAFVENPRAYSRFGVFKVLLTMCKAKMLEIKTRRDVLERRESAGGVRRRVAEHAWPATSRWVCSRETHPHFVIDHGTFNEKKTAELVRDLEVRVFNFPSEDGRVKSCVCEFCGFKQ